MDARQGQRRHAEEERLQRVAQKAAARRAAKAATGAEGDGAKDGAREEPATPGSQQAKEPARGGSGDGDGREAPARRQAARRRERHAARGREEEGEGPREGGRQGRQRRRHGEPAEPADGEADPREGAGQQPRRERRKRKDRDGPEAPAAAAPERPAGRRGDGRGPPPARRGAAAGGEEGPGGGGSSGSDSSEDSSSSSSSSPSSPSATAMAIAKALATGAPVPSSAPSKTPCFAWERSLQPANAGGVPTPQSAIFTGTPVVVPLASSTELEQFLQAGGVDGEAAVRLRALPPQLQRMVMDRGPVAGTRNPSSVVISRIKEVEALRLGALPGAALLGLGTPGAHAGAAGGGGGPPAPSPEIEALISRYSLDPQAASMLRRLSPEQQRLALKLPIQEARNPSAFVMTQLSMPRLLGTGEASRLPTQPHDPTAMMISGLLRF